MPIIRFFFSFFIAFTAKVLFSFLYQKELTKGKPFKVVQTYFYGIVKKQSEDKVLGII